MRKTYEVEVTAKHYVTIQSINKRLAKKRAVEQIKKLRRRHIYDVQATYAQDITAWPFK